MLLRINSPVLKIIGQIPSSLQSRLLASIILKHIRYPNVLEENYLKDQSPSLIEHGHKIRDISAHSGHYGDFNRSEDLNDVGLSDRVYTSDHLSDSNCHININEVGDVKRDNGNKISLHAPSVSVRGDENRHSVSNQNPIDKADTKSFQKDSFRNEITHSGIQSNVSKSYQWSNIGDLANFYPSRMDRLSFCQKWGISEITLDTSLSMLRKIIRKYEHALNEDTEREIKDENISRKALEKKSNSKSKDQLGEGDLERELEDFVKNPISRSNSTCIDSLDSRKEANRHEVHSDGEWKVLSDFVGKSEHLKLVNTEIGNKALKEMQMNSDSSVTKLLLKLSHKEINKRYLFKKHANVPLSKKNYIWERLDEIQAGKINLFELNNILSLSNKTIKDIIEEKLYPPGEITNEKKMVLLKEYRESKVREQETLDELRSPLLNEFGERFVKNILKRMKSDIDYEKWAKNLQLNVRQVRGIIKTFRQAEKGIFTEKSRKILNQLIFKDEALDKDTIISLSTELNLSPSQIYGYLWKKRHAGTRHRSHAKFFKEWVSLNESKLTLPLRSNEFLQSNLQDLIQRTHLGHLQIYRLIHYYLQKPGVITDFSHHLVKRYIERNQLKKLSIADIQKLALEARLSTNQVKYLARIVFDPKGELTREKKDFIFQSVRDFNFNISQINFKSLAKETGLSLDQVRRVANSTLKIREITQEDRDKISQILKKKKELSPFEKRKLRLELQLSPSQMKYLINVCQDPPSPVTLVKKSSVFQWLRENKTHSLPLDIRKHFQKTLGLSSSQLSSIIYQYNNQPGCFTDEARSICLKWISEKGRDPSPQETASLMEATGLNRRQIHSFINSKVRSKESLTPEKKEMIIEILNDIYIKQNLRGDSQEILQNSQNSQNSSQEGLSKMPSELFEKSCDKSCEKSTEIIEKTPAMNKVPKEIITMIQKKVGLSKKQIHQVIHRHLNPSGEITGEKKRALSEWIKEHKEPLTRNEFNHLADELELTVTQVRQLLERIRNTQNELTTEKKNVLKEWMANLKEPPTRDDMKQKSQEVNLSYRQVYDFYRRHKKA